MASKKEDSYKDGFSTVVNDDYTTVVRAGKSDKIKDAYDALYSNPKYREKELLEWKNASKSHLK